MQEPAILSVESSQACFGLVRFPVHQGRSPVTHQSGEVGWMHRRLPPPTARFLQRESGVVLPTLVEKIDVAVGQRGPDHPGNRIDGQPELIPQRLRLLERASQSPLRFLVAAHVSLADLLIPWSMERETEEVHDTLVLDPKAPIPRGRAGEMRRVDARLDTFDSSTRNRPPSRGQAPHSGVGTCPALSLPNERRRNPPTHSLPLKETRCPSYIPPCPLDPEHATDCWLPWQLSSR